MPDSYRSAAPPPSPTLLTNLERAPDRNRSAPPARPIPRWMEALLRIPLPGKLVGANLLIILIAFVAAFTAGGAVPASADMLLIVALALAGSLVVNMGLLFLALRPLQELETTAAQVWQGDLDARVHRSLLADRHVTRVGNTFNLLLDGLTADRARTRRLASEIIGAGDRERAYVARELHDSVAQTLAALVMQLGAAARDSKDAALASRLDDIKQIGNDALEEVRMLAHTMHPRVLDDLGLIAALRNLGRQVGERGGVTVTVEEENTSVNDIPPAIASVLYRVAQEAVSNAVRHGHAQNVRITVTTDNDTATLNVVDDGQGFNVQEAERRRPGMGLFTMRERVALMNGRFEIVSHPGAGTRITATCPRS